MGTKKKLSIYLILLSSSFLLFFEQCKHEPVITPYSGTVCFSSDIMPMVISTCAKPGCHDAIYHRENLDLTNYNSIKNDALSGDLMKYARYGSSEMNINSPSPQTLTTLDLKSLSMIQKWIDDGAPNSICDNCDTILVAFSTHIYPLIQKSCIGCHSGSAKTQLTNYPQAKSSVDNGKLYCAISQSTGCLPMPQGGNKLSDCTIKMVKIWIDAGAPNN
jgi:hypothetical protein